MRKFWLTLASIAVFGTVLFVNPNINPFELGMGLGFLIAPMAVANAMEHKFKNGK